MSDVEAGNRSNREKSKPRSSIEDDNNEGSIPSREIRDHSVRMDNYDNSSADYLFRVYCNCSHCWH